MQIEIWDSGLISRTETRVPKIVDRIEASSAHVAINKFTTTHDDGTGGNGVFSSKAFIVNNQRFYTNQETALMFFNERVDELIRTGKAEFVITSDPDRPLLFKFK